MVDPPGPEARRRSVPIVDDGGQSTVELAVLLPVLALAMLALVQIGLVGRDYLLVWHAARESARQAAVDPSASAALSGARRASPGLRSGNLSVTLAGGSSSGELVTARVHYRSPTEVPLVGSALGDVEMTAEVTMRVE
jgi:Flp pilus assembly protein TadG